MNVEFGDHMKSYVQLGFKYLGLLVAAHQALYMCTRVKKTLEDHLGDLHDGLELASDLHFQVLTLLNHLQSQN